MSEDNIIVIIGGIIIGSIFGYVVVLVPLTLIVGNDVSNLPTWCYWVAGVLGLLIGITMALLFTWFVYKIGITVLVLGGLPTNMPENDIVAFCTWIAVIAFLLWLWVPALLNFLIKLFSSLLTALIGLLVLFSLLQMDVRLWMSAAGLAFLVVGMFLAGVSRNKESRLWALNALEANALGVIMIITGVVTYFTHNT